MRAVTWEAEGNGLRASHKLSSLSQQGDVEFNQKSQTVSLCKADAVSKCGGFMQRAGFSASAALKVSHCDGDKTHQVVSKTQSSLSLGA